MSSRIIMNGQSYSGRSIQIRGNNVIIDGKDVTPDAKIININVEGNCENLQVDACEKINVGGVVTTLHTMSGDVDVHGDVKGDVTTMSGDVECGNVGGSIRSTSGDVKCGTVQGNVNTVSGDIKHK